MHHHIRQHIAFAEPHNPDIQGTLQHSGISLHIVICHNRLEILSLA